MFGFIKNKLKKIYNQVTSKAAALFSRTTIDETFLKELKELLIYADTGITTTNKIMEHLTEAIKANRVENPQDIKRELEQQLINILTTHQVDHVIPPVLLLVGINGSGKTTFAAKLAHKLKEENKKILLVAGDTFRAAATEQLETWGNKINVDVFVGQPNQSKGLHLDPASVVFDGCQKFATEGYDHIIIDTAGRLQTKINLMKELEKIRKIITKKLPNVPTQTWLTIDAMLGQNSFEQAKLFHEATKLDGLILTKMDGTGKGGIVFSITNQLHLPLVYVTFGEAVTALKPFNAQEYVKDLLGA